MSDKNVDLEFSAHHAFLQSPSSGTLKAIVNAQNRIILCSVNNGKEIALPCPLKPQTMQ
jgi:hypothetical protein